MDDECLNASKRLKIQDAVLQILKTSDLETITEFSVRSAAAVRLGFELSSLNHRRLVRQLVDSFLLATAAEIVRTNSLHRINDGSDTDVNADSHTNQRPQQLLDGVGVETVESEANYNGKIICKLSDKRRVTIHDSYGTTMVAIRDFYIKDGNMLPEKGGNSGISLTATQWSSFRNSFPSIQEAISRLESRSRSIAVPKQSEAVMTSSMADPATEKSQTEASISNVRRVVFPPTKRKQNGTEPDIRNSVADFPSEKGQAKPIPASRNETESDISAIAPLSPTQRHHDTVQAVPPDNLIPSKRKQAESDSCTSVPSFRTVHATRPERLIPIQTTRFDGRNYHSWRHQMEFFLNQSNIAYVLSEVCPSLSLPQEASSEERVKVKSLAQKWTDDDYMCRHHILNSLCDNLFQLYSQKNGSARELWEELKFVYDDDFGTKRSQINKYIHFQMVDGVSILEQVQELHRIVDSVIASGTWIEENFHVSVIVSKLPPSWKELRFRLMQEEFLPLNMLMHRIRAEEDARKWCKKETNSKKDHAVEPKVDCRVGMRKNENKRGCYSCGKEGHVIKNCPDRKSEDCNKSCGKDSGNVSPCAGT